MYKNFNIPIMACSSINSLNPDLASRLKSKVSDPKLDPTNRTTLPGVHTIIPQADEMYIEPVPETALFDEVTVRTFLVNFVLDCLQVSQDCDGIGTVCCVLWCLTDFG